MNRNYDYNWNQGDAKDSVTCLSETYPGPNPFSEKETQVFRDFITSKKDELRLVYNLHCAGNFFILPFNGV